MFCRYLKVPLFEKKLVNNFVRRPSLSFFCRYLKVPLFEREQCTYSKSLSDFLKHKVVSKGKNGNYPFSESTPKYR